MYVTMRQCLKWHIAPWFCSFRLWRYINHLLTYLLTYLNEFYSRVGNAGCCLSSLATDSFHGSATAGMRMPLQSRKDIAMMEPLSRNIVPTSQKRCSLDHFNSQLTVFHKHRRRSSVNFRGKTILPEKYVYEKLTKCPNFTRFLPKN